MLPALLVLLFEANLFGMGMFAEDGRMQYILETLGVLLVIAEVPLSLKLFNIMLKKMSAMENISDRLETYKTWSAVRLAMLETAAVLNIIIYYLTMNNIGGFCAVIALAASIFCFPSDSRLRTELQLSIEE
ncbi:hypothetical protein D0T50_01650 [Bacteroides sp. 214]|nr:hypothetical protein [Bacteroides sp. 214]